MERGEQWMESVWLRCKVLPGMFSEKSLVIIERPNGGEIVSFLVDKGLVEVAQMPEHGRSVDGRLRVQASQRDSRVNVMLPVSTAEFGRVLSVPSELVAAI